MSAEIITAVITVATFTLAVLGGTWKMNASLKKNIDTRFDKVDTELKEIRSDIGDLKERVARIEGPTPRFQLK